MIYDLFLRRKLIDLGTDLINESYSNFNDQDSVEIIERTESGLFNLANQGDFERGPKHFDDVLVETLNYAEKAFKKSSKISIKLVPGTGSPPIPTHVDWPKEKFVVCATAS